MNHGTTRAEGVRSGSREHRTPPWLPALLLITLLPGVAAFAQAPPPMDAPDLVAVLTRRAFAEGQGGQAADGRELFAAVLGSELFLHRAVGPFDLYVALAEAPGQSRDVAKLLDDAAAGLEPVVPLISRYWTGGNGVVSGRRFPMLLSDAGRASQEFDALIALLDHCEDLGYSGWKPVNVVWSASNRRAEVVRTWEVQVFNLQHAVIADRREDWLEHGIGYYAITHIVNRAIRKGAWGMSPPWFDQGLIDELDIQAYGKAWVGSESWSAETAGWYRPGWSGFLPKGMSPPPAPVGPPLDLATTVERTGNPWADRINSPDRHWSELAADRSSDAPASFAYMAAHQSFLPRDRAYARCALNLALEIAPADDSSLFDRFDAEVPTPPDGMPGCEPLTVLVSAWLGGVPEVEAMEKLTLRDVPERVGREDIADAMRSMQAEGLLALSDHREQSHWLYSAWRGSMETHTKLFHLIMEAEHEQQLAEWRLIGEHLDRGMQAALQATERYPASGPDRAMVADVFRGTLAGKPVESSCPSRKPCASDRP